MKLTDAGFNPIERKAFMRKSLKLIKHTLKVMLSEHAVRCSDVDVNETQDGRIAVHFAGYMQPRKKIDGWRVMFFVNGDEVENFVFNAPCSITPSYEHNVVEHSNKSLSLNGINGLIYGMSAKNQAAAADYARDVAKMGLFTDKITDVLGGLHPTIKSLYNEYERAK